MNATRVIPPPRLPSPPGSLAWLPLLIGGVGLAVQLFLTVLCMMGEVVVPREDRLLLELAEDTWGAMPVLSVLGLLIAVRQLRAHAGALLVSAGLLLNVLWLACGMAIWWFVWNGHHSKKRTGSVAPRHAPNYRVQATPDCGFCLFAGQWPGAPDPAR